MNKRFTIKVCVDEEKLRKATDDKESEIMSLVASEMGWVEESGITIESVEYNPEDNRPTEAVTYHGVDFPVRTIQLSSKEAVMIGTESLQRVLIDSATSTYTDAEARDLDESIYYYVSDNDITLGDEELTKKVKLDTGYNDEEEGIDYEQYKQQILNS